MLTLQNLLRFRSKDDSTLQEVVMHSGPLDGLALAELFNALLNTLRTLHREGLALGDLKASRVLLGDPIRVVTRNEQGALMEIDVLEGAPHYLAPECILHGDVTPATDVYALGALMFFALTGRHAMDGGNAVEICEGHLYRDLPRVSGPYGALIAQMMDKDPRARPTIQELSPRVAA